MGPHKEFKCQRCGRCCLRVSLSVTVPSEDIEKWKNDGRDDILEWTRALPWGGADIWINKYSGGDDIPVNCPWLRKDENNNLACSIQKNKPSCCQDYGHCVKRAVASKCSFHTGETFKPDEEELKRIPTTKKWKDYDIELTIRVPNTESMDEWDILNFIKYKITGDDQYLDTIADLGLPENEVISKLDKAITIFRDEIEES